MLRLKFMPKFLKLSKFKVRGKKPFWTFYFAEYCNVLVISQVLDLFVCKVYCNYYTVCNKQPKGIFKRFPWGCFVTLLLALLVRTSFFQVDGLLWTPAVFK